MYPDRYADCHNLKAITDSLPGKVCPITLLQGSPDPDLTKIIQVIETDWDTPSDHVNSCWWDRIQVASAADPEGSPGQIRTNPAEYAVQMLGNREAVEQLLSGLFAINSEQRWSATDALDAAMFHSERDRIAQIRNAYPGIQIPCVRPDSLLPMMGEIGHRSLLEWVMRMRHLARRKPPTPAQLMAYSAVIPIVNRAYTLYPARYTTWDDAVCLSQCAMAIAHQRFSRTDIPDACRLWWMWDKNAEHTNESGMKLLQMERDLVNALASTIGNVTLLSWTECHLDAEEAINLIRQRATRLVPVE